MRYIISSHHVVVTLFPLPLWVPVMIFDRILVLKTVYFWDEFRSEGVGEGASMPSHIS